MVPTTLKTRLFARFYTSFLVLVLLLVGHEGLSFSIGVLTQRAARWVNRTLLVKLEGQRLLNAAMDEQTGLRGYLLTTDRASLEPYRRGKAAFRSSLNRLYTLVADNPAQLKELDKIKDLYDRWQSQFAQRAVSGLTSRSTVLAGKTLFDPLRTQVRNLLQRQEIQLIDRNRWLHRLYWMKTALDMLSIVVLLAGVGLNLWLLHRRVEVPLRQLTKVGQAWRKKLFIH